MCQAEGDSQCSVLHLLRALFPSQIHAEPPFAPAVLPCAAVHPLGGQKNVQSRAELAPVAVMSVPSAGPGSLCLEQSCRAPLASSPRSGLCFR